MTGQHAAERLKSRIVWEVTSPQWWRAALMRALYTAAAAAIPYVTASLGLHLIGWTVMASAVALAAIASLVTSLAGLTELGDGAPWWQALISRTVRTAAQSLVAGIGAATLWGEVDWLVILSAAGSAALVSMLRSAVMRLPETSISPSPAS